MSDESARPVHWLDIPNLITISRVLMAVVLFALIEADGWWKTATVLFAVAAATDFLDGYIARRYGLVTPLGRILDPFADKIIICGVCTDICVLHTTSDARNRDYTVEVPSDCVATFDPDAHQWALGHLENILGARVL